MRVGNLIEVSFGKPGGTPSGDAAHICDENDDASAPVAEFSQYRDAKKDGFLSRTKVIALTAENDLVIVGMMISEEDRHWLEAHPELVKEVFGRISSIETAAGKAWTVRADTIPEVKFPEEWQDCLRLFFYVEEQEEERIVWEGGVYFALERA